MNYITAEELDRKFDEGEDVMEFFDLSTVKRPGLETKDTNADFAKWMVDTLDKEPQAQAVIVLIKDWIAERDASLAV